MGFVKVWLRFEKSCGTHQKHEILVMVGYSNSLPPLMLTDKG